MGASTARAGCRCAQLWKRSQASRRIRQIAPVFLAKRQPAGARSLCHTGFDIMRDRMRLAALISVVAAACSGGSIEDSGSNSPGGSTGAAFATSPPVKIDQETRLARLSQPQY